jgi:mono/diheme cytochrome c family protein
MKTVKTVIVTLVVVALVAFGYVLTGWYNIAATDPHNNLTLRILDLALDRSVEHHAAGLHAPFAQPDSATLRLGANHYQHMCRGCHGSPGDPRRGGRGGMYPSPPDFSKGMGEWSVEEIYWIAKNGIKMSGMPSYGASHTEAELWAMAAFGMTLSKLNPEQYLEMSADPASGAEDEDHH